MSIQYRLGDHPIRHTSPFENPVSKKQAPPFSNGSQFWLFLAKKEAKLLAQGPGRKKSRYNKKLVKSGLTLFPFPLHTTGS